MQSLCTLRDHCRQGSRNTRYQAGAAPYLDRSSTGWIAPACLAHSFDHLVGAQKDRWRHGEAKRLGRLGVYSHLEFHWYLNWQVGRLLTAQNTINVGGTATNYISEVWSICEQSAIISNQRSPGIDRWYIVSGRE